MRFWYLTIALTFSTGIFWLFYRFLSRRYELQTGKVFLFILLFSFVSSLATFINLNAAFADSARWQQLTVLKQPVSQLVFQTNLEVFAVTNNKERIKITDALSSCPPNSSYLERRSNIKLTANPPVSLPPPPSLPSDQLTLEFVYFGGGPESDVIILIGATSYAAYSNGEIWCIEKIIRNGSDPAIVGNFIVPCGSIGVFMGIFVIATTFTVLVLDFRHWRKSVNQSSNSERAA